MFPPQEKRNSTPRKDRGGEQIPEQRNAQQKYNHRAGGENQPADVGIHRHPRNVNFRKRKFVHGTSRPYPTGRASAVVPSIPPNPMVSTAEEGTITIEPFSLSASYSMFMARRCSAIGLSA